MLYLELIENKIPFKNPQIGWWRDNDPLTLYHGTHKRNLESILENGISAPKSGPTAGWVSLALEPNTAFGYASMSGESAFRAAGAKAVHVPMKDRVVLVLEIKWSDLEGKFTFGGNTEIPYSHLTQKELYDRWKKSDIEYYQQAEIRVPKHVPAKYIKGYMTKV